MSENRVELVQSKWMNASTRRQKRALYLTVIAFVALSLLGYGAWGLWRQYRATHNPSATILAATIVHSADDPDETPLTDECESYQVPTNEPRKIEITSIGVAGCIQRVGIDQHNQIAVPTNIHLAGWYTDSVVPGEKGVSVIDGHVLGRYSSAIFGRLGEVRPGDTVRIQRGDASWLAFSVVDVHRYSIDETMSHLLQPLEGTDAQVTLITCSGTYDSRAKTYDQRMIVRAKLL